MHHTMIDTVHLAIPRKSYKIAKDNNLEIKCKISPCGELLEIAKYCNQYEVKPTLFPNEVLYVNCGSIPKLLYGNNVAMVKETDIDKCKETVIEQLRKCGIETDLQQYYVTRVDFCSNVTVDVPVGDIIAGLVHNYSMPYMVEKDVITKRNRVETGYFRLQSRQREFCLYDKSSESHLDGRLHGRLLRLEYRLKTKSLVEDYTCSTDTKLEHIMKEDLSKRILTRALQAMVPETKPVRLLVPKRHTKMTDIEVVLGMLDSDTRKRCLEQLLRNYQSSGKSRWQVWRYQKRLHEIERRLAETEQVELIPYLLEKLEAA